MTGSMTQLLIAMLAFGTIGIFRRHIGTSSAFLAMARGLIGGFFLVLFCLLRKIRISFSDIKKNLLLLVISGAFIGFNWILLFEAYNYTSVAVATLCYYMAPIAVILVSPLLFREKLTPVKLLCVGAALFGMVLVSGVFDTGLPEGSSAKGILLGLGAAALYASVVLMNKKISGISAYDKTMVQLFCAGLVILPYLFLTKDPWGSGISGLEIFLIAFVGVFHTGICYALYFGSLDKLPVQTAALFSYLDPISAIILSALLLGEKMSPAGIVGAVLVLGALIFSELYPGKPSKPSGNEKQM